MIVTLSGCANPFKQSYVSRLEGQPLSAVPGLDPQPGPVRVMRTPNLQAAAEELLEEGYAMVGYSLFTATAVDEGQARQFAQELDADVVLLTRDFAGVDVDYYPTTVATPYYWDHWGYGPGFGPHFGRWGPHRYLGSGFSTAYVPYAVNRYAYYASYWVKRASPVLGAIVSNLPPELRQKLERNAGVVVRVIVRGSPAWEANLVPGDVITAVAGEAVSDAESYQRLTERHAGETVRLTVLRDGKERLMEVRLNPLSGAATRGAGR